MLFVQRLCLIFALMAALAFLPASAQESRQEPPAVCTPVAQVFGHTICREAVEVEDAHLATVRQEYAQQGLDAEQALKARSRERLEDMVWQTALERKFGNQALEPTDEEVAAYAAAFKQALERGHAENLRALAKAKTLLETGKFTPEQEGKLKLLIASLQTGIAFYEQRQKYRKDMPPEFHDMVKTAEDEMARTMMRSWKKDRALYQAYGGRVAMRGGGIVPVDGYARFLDYIRKEGALQVADGDYRDIFTDLESFIAAPSLLPADQQARGQDYFSSPAAALALPSVSPASDQLP